MPYTKIDLEKINIKEILEFLPEKGEISLFGDRMLLFREDAMGHLWNQIFNQVGFELGRSIISKFGYECGYGDFFTISKKFPNLNPEKILALGPQLHTHEGLVHVTPVESNIDLAKGKFYYKGEWRNSFEVNIFNKDEIRLSHFSPNCFALAGYASGWCSAFAGVDVVAYETKCQSQGSECCHWEILPIGEVKKEHAAWVNALTKDHTSIHAALHSKNSELESKITALNETRKLLIANENRFQDIVENISDWIWEFDTEYKFTYVSPTVTKILGYKPSDLIGRSAFDIIPPHEVPQVEKEFLPLAKKQLPFYNLINVNIHKDGHYVTLESSGVPFYDLNNNFIGYRGIDRDVTERENQKKELALAKQKAEEANLAKSNFLAIMSHEIRTPMNSILGMTEIVKDGGLSPSELEFYSSIILKNGRVLKNLLDDIVDLTKVETKKINIESTTFNLVELVKDIIDSSQVLLRENKVSMECNCHQIKKQIRLGDPVRLRQVLFNLVSNALKFTHDGLIVISMTEMSGSRVFFEVKDNGIGISKEQLEKIFEIFTQGDYSITRRYGGSGIGLSLTKELLELMGSRIQVESTPGKGSRFFFELNLPEAIVTKVDQSKDFQRLLSSLPPKKILVVEDSEDNVVLIQAFLKRFKMTIDVATSGKESIVKAQKSRYDLILMDIQMPELDGLSATKMIRKSEQENNLPKTPIIALSAHVLKEDREKSLLAGCDDHLGKPILRDLFFERIYYFLK